MTPTDAEVIAASHRDPSASLSSSTGTRRTCTGTAPAGPGSYGEVARALEIPVGTVRSRLHRARSRLRPVLADLADLADLAAGAFDKETLNP